MLNKACLIGHLGHDPEVRYTQNNTAVANFRIATTEKWKDRDGNQQEKTEWHRIVAWGRLGEVCGEYLKKGRQVYVEGRIETREWEDKDGQRRFTTEIRASEVKFLGGGGNGSGGSSRSGGRADTPPPLDDGDIPF